MKGPYFITTLDADVRIHPSQMNNNIIDNIKKNIEQRYLQKCYGNYGYVDKIFEIDPDIKGGIIRAEDVTSSSIHRVKFSCRICNPIKTTVIMGKIMSINNMMIVAENGPICFIIGNRNFNTSNVQFRSTAFYPLNKNGDIINKPIDKGSYVMIKVLGKKLVQNKNQIIVYGFLESVIPDDKVKDAIKNNYNENEKINAERLINNDENEESNEYIQEDTQNDGENDDN